MQNPKSSLLLWLKKGGLEAKARCKCEYIFGNSSIVTVATKKGEFYFFFFFFFEGGGKFPLKNVCKNVKNPTSSAQGVCH